MSDSSTIHSVDFSDHRETYDYCMTDCLPGDFVELNNGEVVYLMDAWPVLIKGDNSPGILHVSDDSLIVDALVVKYEMLKEAQAQDTPSPKG